VNPVAREVTDQLFRIARMHSAWLDEPVGNDVLVQVYELAKWGPTSANTCTLPIVFVRSSAAKEKLLSVVSEGTRDKTRAAPVTAILRYDVAFY
jgi:3-hydroxypropanoate dehydrogenase